MGEVGLGGGRWGQVGAGGGRVRRRAALCSCVGGGGGRVRSRDV